MAVSARDIAKALNVSPATVSMALRDHKGISDETKSRVLEMAEKVGYTKHLKSSRPTVFIHLVIYKKHGNVVSDTPFFSQLIQGIDFQTKKRGCNLLVSYYYETQDPKEQLRSLASSNCSGIILLATEMFPNDLQKFSGLGIPMLILDNYFISEQYDCVGINNMQGAYTAVKHLIDIGHTKIGYLSSKTEIQNFRERREGYQKALELIGKATSDDQIVKVSPVAEEAIKDMGRYLSNNHDLPTAYYADNDIIATSCMRALKEYGYKVPEDISIIGFDDVPVCQLVEPQLSTMQVPKHSMGIHAVERLLDNINGNTKDNIRIQMSTKLIIRNSVSNID